MSIDAKAEAILAANFSEECGDPDADAKRAAAQAIKALGREGMIIAMDPEA